MLPPSPTVELEMPMVYSMPAASPLYPPPPFKYVGNRQATILFKTTAETLKRLVPAPLKPNPDQLIGVYSGLLAVTEPFPFTYHEVGVIVPVTHSAMAGLFFTHLYLDTATGIAAGREIWGFPKKEADITFTEAGGVVSTVVSRLGATLMKATVRPVIRVEVVPPNPYQYFYNLKAIPSVKRGAPPDVLQLTAVPYVHQTTELHQGPGTLDLGNSPQDLLADIPILEVAGAQFEVYDMTLDYGEVVVDYLAHH